MGTVIGLLEHPSVRAWGKLAPNGAEPTAIAALGDRDKAAVYRLTGVGLDGSSVVAKHCRTNTALIERAVYEQVLPDIPVTALHYYGCTAEEDGSCWLFVEDAAGVSFTPLLEEHCVLAARWLALLHTSAACVASAARLPDRGPAHYMEHLRSARPAILSAAKAAARRSERAMLEQIVRQCDVIESRWHEVEEWCAPSPATLVHGDFRPKNVHVRFDSRGARLFAWDWEMAGWGVPAADLASIRGLHGGEPVALRTYLDSAQASWPSLDARSIVRLVDVGKLFRRLAAVSWCSLSLESRWQKAVASLRVHEAALGAAIASAKWAL